MHGALIDPLGVQDLFAEGIGEIEVLSGNCVRFTLYSRQGDDMVTVAKIVSPISAVPDAIQQMTMLLAAKAGAAVTRAAKRLSN